MTKQPTTLQVLAAKIRAEKEAYVDLHKEPCEGGFYVPDRDQVYQHLAEKFGLSPLEISYFFTYARQCTHEWSEGSCPLCPVPAGVQAP